MYERICSLLRRGSAATLLLSAVATAIIASSKPVCSDVRRVRPGLFGRSEGTTFPACSNFLLFFNLWFLETIALCFKFRSFFCAVCRTSFNLAISFKIVRLVFMLLVVSRSFLSSAIFVVVSTMESNCCCCLFFGYVRSLVLPSFRFPSSFSLDEEISLLRLS